MHIVFITTDFIEKKGPTTGLPKYLLRVSTALIRMGHEVSIITGFNHTVFYEFSGINVYRIRRPAMKQYSERRKNTIAECLRDGQILNQALVELYKKEKIDIVQYTSLRGLAFFHNLPVPAVTRLSSYAKMVTLDGQEIEKEVKAEFERAAVCNSNAIFGPSEVVAREMAADTGIHIDVIESPFVMDDEEEDFSLFNECFAEKKYILFYGTLIKYKGLYVIADAVHSVLDKYQGLHIGIIGNGDTGLIDLIKHNAGKYADRIIYHPAVGFSQLKPVICHAESIMLPSLMENLSNACIECMALGQIVIGTRGASFDQLIDDGQSGFLCEIGDSVSLSQAVDKVMALTTEQKKVICHNAQKRAERLSPDIVVNQLIEYYKKVINDFKTREEKK